MELLIRIASAVQPILIQPINQHLHIHIILTHPHNSTISMPTLSSRRADGSVPGHSFWDTNTGPISIVVRHEFNYRLKEAFRSRQRLKRRLPQRVSIWVTFLKRVDFFMED